MSWPRGRAVELLGVKGRKRKGKERREQTEKEERPDALERLTEILLSPKPVLPFIHGREAHL